jgi:hypothetical protein
MERKTANSLSCPPSLRATAIYLDCPARPATFLWPVGGKQTLQQALGRLLTRQRFLQVVFDFRQ